MSSNLLDRMKDVEDEQQAAMMEAGEEDDDDDDVSISAEDIFGDAEGSSSLYTDGSSIYAEEETSSIYLAEGGSFDVEEDDIKDGQADKTAPSVEFTMSFSEQGRHPDSSSFEIVQGSFPGDASQARRTARYSQPSVEFSMAFSEPGTTAPDESHFEVFQGSFAGDVSQRRRSSIRRHSSHSSGQSSQQSDESESGQSKSRRVSISVPEEGTEVETIPHRHLGQTHDEQTVSRRDPGSRAMSKRRSSIMLTSPTPSSRLLDASAPSVMKSIRSRLSHRHGSGGRETPSTALDTFGRAATTDLSNVAAAAAVVAAESVNRRMQFSVGDSALAFLNILNHTNSADAPDSFTIEPVNKYGFAPGEGHSNEELRGPFVYVLVTVKKVHFDEDVPYYTVVRGDTGTEQRCDAAWMEQLTNPVAVESASRSARRTRQSVDEISEIDEDQGAVSTLWACIVLWPIHFAWGTIVPWYQRTRAGAKEHLTHILYGDAPFACRIRFTGVNFLVVCNLIFAFIEPVTLTFIPARLDHASWVTGLVVWCILAFELVLEFLVRPSNYYRLVESDRAYAPSTARNINTFHLFFETVALVLFIPHFTCLGSDSCGERKMYSGINAALNSVYGATVHEAAFGRFYIGLQTLRIYGLIRRWKNMWINNTFNEGRQNEFLKFFTPEFAKSSAELRQHFSLKGKTKVEDEVLADSIRKSFKPVTPTEEDDRRLRSAATVGTALMVINSHRALMLLTVIFSFGPLISSIKGVNYVADKSVDLLFQNNIQVPGNDSSSCAYFENAIFSWLASVPLWQTEFGSRDEPYLLFAQVLPARCGFESSDGIIAACTKDPGQGYYCNVTYEESENLVVDDVTPQSFADLFGIRVGGITEFVRSSSIGLNGTLTGTSSEEFSVKVIINQNSAVHLVFFSFMLLLTGVLLLCLLGLAVLRVDAEKLVLDPLQRMLKIVIRYATNPLSPAASERSGRRKSVPGSHHDVSGHGDDDDVDIKEQVGNWETEQLIIAITKITDLLRKCWGVAGSHIISSNLARTKGGRTVVFNPTVAGKRVYALFGFVVIDGFSEMLRALDRDVMILINDVAKVVHDEVYRWALGDSGQCNKNLGSSFLMVFRIGDFTEVREKQARATDVVFSSTAERKSMKTLRQRGLRRGQHSRRSVRAMHGEPNDILQLASLPGIQAFSDRALLGMLKSYAGVCRDKSLQNWKKDFRLGAGVGLFSVNILIGMDAGWAVEGAVGSTFKIDATYLSPHVNMASRMCSACKQYGVNVLLSQAVEELLSKPARKKLRHLDTVFVKGSSIAQRIFTFDARQHGVDFFLFERPPEIADADAESYTPAVWNTDQDVGAMRQHVTEEFVKKYSEGKDQYLRGDWKSAIATLQAADDIMIRTVLEEGYIDYNPDAIDGRIFDRGNGDEEAARLRQELGDGASKCLVAYMERRGGIPPSNWIGVRPLTSK